MRNISVSVDKNGHVSTDMQQLGYSGEHNAVMLTVSFTNDGYEIYSPCEYFRIIIDGNYSDELYMVNESLNYPVPQQCMIPPAVHGQLVGYITTDGEPVEIIKSEIFELLVDRSQVPNQKASYQTDAFERTLAECKVAAEVAKSSADSAVISAQSAMESADGALTSEENARKSQAVCEESALSAENSAKRAEQRNIDLNNLSNSLKGNATGEVVTLTDVSPIEHELTVKLSGDMGTTGTYPVSATFTQKGDTMSLHSSVKNVTVNIPFVSSFCVGVLVPIINGVSSADLLNNAAIPLQYAYTEAGGTFEIAYSISGSVVSWNGYKWMESYPDYKTEISGSYDTGVTDIAISGFVQPFGLDEDNPYYKAHEFDSISFDINAVVPFEGGEVTVEFIVKNDKDEVVAEYAPNADGTVNGVISLYPTMTLSTSKDGVTIYCEYNRDINKFEDDIKELNIPSVDQTYSPDSENAQSGKAVAEAVDGKAYELIDIITIDEESVMRVLRDTEPDGTAYNFKKIHIQIKTFDTNMSGLCRVVYAHRNVANKFDDRHSAMFYNTSYNLTHLFCEKQNGEWKMDAVVTHTNGVTRSVYSEINMYNLLYDSITGVCIQYNNTFVVGTEIKIYGVRA